MNEAHLPAEPIWFARLLTHMAWADQDLLDAVEAHPSQAAVRLLGHVVVAERIWLGRIRGEDLPLTPWEPRDLPAIRGLVQETRDGFASFVAGLDPASLTESVRYCNSRGRNRPWLWETSSCTWPCTERITGGRSVRSWLVKGMRLPWTTFCLRWGNRWADEAR